MDQHELDKTLKLYASIMEEIKERSKFLEEMIVNQDKLPAMYSFELCQVQIRKISELLALACLTAHGDIPQVKSSSLQNEWNAEQIMKKLARLHPEFFPVPHSKEKNTDGSFFMAEKEGGFLTREELIKFYNKSATHLHRGHIRGLLTKWHPDIDFGEIRSWNARLGQLLAPYHYNRIANDAGMILCVMNNENDNNKVQSVYAKTLVAPKRDKDGKLVRQRG